MNKYKNILIVFSFFIFGTALITSHALISYNESKEILQTNIARELVNKGNLVSLAIDADKMEKLINEDNVTEETSKFYQEIHSSLHRAHLKANELQKMFRYVYTTHYKNDGFYFGVDTAPKEDTDKDGKIDHSFLNDKYDEYPEEMKVAFDSGKIQSTKEPYTDQWGTFMAVFIPIINKGKVVSVLGIDVTVHQYLFDLKKLRNRVYIYVFFSVVILLLFSIILYVFLNTNQKLKKQLLAQKETELQLIQQEKLAEIGLLSSSITHEINNPLSVIQLHLISMRKKINDPVKLENSIVRIEEAYQKIQNTLTSMKNFVRKDDSNKVETSMDKIILDTLNFLNPKIKHCEVIKELNSPSTFKCFETQISQVLLNFITNATDAMENDFIKKIIIQSQENNGTLIVKVKNSGPPIPDELLKKIQLGFFSTKEKGKGSGMGLMISRKIIENHGGVLKYKEEDNMPCFYFEIPLEQETTKEVA